MSGTTSPIRRLWPRRRVAAAVFGTKSVAAIAASTFARVASATTSGRLRVLETVAIDTPAALATARSPARVFAGRATAASRELIVFDSNHEVRFRLRGDHRR